jgi:hypothetical protein
LTNRRASEDLIGQEISQVNFHDSFSRSPTRPSVGQEADCRSMVTFKPVALVGGPTGSVDRRH